MPIEYLPGLKAGDKIKLDESPIRPEFYVDKLDKAMAKLAEANNQDLGFEFLDKDNRVAMTGSSALEDSRLMAERETEWASQMHKTVSQWKADQYRNPANLAEMALTILLDKYFGKDFLVARASLYDDYQNGADTIIIDRQTGALVCGFDEVLGHQGDDGGQKKSDKIRKIMTKGGSQIKYGAELLGDKLQAASRRQVPTFYLSISKEELNKLLGSFFKESAIKDEEKVIKKLLHSLKDQANKHQELKLHPSLKTNLNNFLQSWQTMQDSLDLAN